MDEFLEQMLSASSWGDGVSLNRASWDAATVSSGNGLSIDPTGGLQGLPKLSTIPTMPSVPLGGRQENQVLNRASQDQGNGSGLVGEECPPGKASVSPRFQHRDALFESSQATPQDAANMSLQKFSEGPATGVSAVLQLNANASQSLPSIGCPPRGPLLLKNTSFEGSGFQQTSHNLQGSTIMAPTWRQPYIGSVPPLPSPLNQGNSETFSLRGEAISNGVNPGKRSRDEEDFLRESHPVSMLHVAQQPQGVQQGQGHGDQSPLPQNPAGNGANGAVRARVRARRGQATDPHSIAERNRRERIAERMKALQELVPDSNKTDKASMLDEIIGYVKFLQMQVKCLSMCRLGGAGAAAPLFADLPAEGAGNFIAASLAQANGAPGASQDGIAFAERQVARLMDEDMSAAMQYLQSKGLCLMPISLATAISSTGARQQSTSIKGLDTSGNEKQAMELQFAAATGSTNPAVMATLANSGVSALGNDGIVKSGGNMPNTLRDVRKDENMNEETST